MKKILLVTTLLLFVFETKILIASYTPLTPEQLTECVRSKKRDVISLAGK
jgi:hypothetical protein